MNMNQEIADALHQSMKNYCLPRYEQIPDIGLYLEQVTKYISGCTEPLGLGPLTGSMVSNYVKQGIIQRPCKKQYHRDLIAQLIFIALAKSILSLDDLQKFLRLQQRTVPLGTAYDYFCQELQSALQALCGWEDLPGCLGEEHTILHTIVITVAHKIYLQKYIAAAAEPSADRDVS